MYELTKINTKELTVADAVAIKEATGYDVAIPEHKVYVEKTQGAVAYLLQHPDYMSMLKVSSIAEIVSRDSVLTLRNVQNFAGLAYIQSILVLAITDLIKLFNVSKPMTAEQIAAVVDCMLETQPLYWLTLADIKLCFKYLYMGKYGKIYDRIDANTILDALNQYYQERCVVAYSYANKQHQQTKQYRSNRVGEVKIGQLLKK